MTKLVLTDNDKIFEIDNFKYEDFAVNLRFTDIQIPSKSLNDYSTAISIPRNKDTDTIFSNMFRLDFINNNAIAIAADYYIKFQLYINGSIKQRGYCKIETVNIDSYTIRFYNEKGFIFKLIGRGNDIGNDSSNTDVMMKNFPVTFDKEYTIDRNLVYDCCTNDNGGIYSNYKDYSTGQTDTRNIIKFVLTYQGVYPNFVNKKTYYENPSGVINEDENYQYILSPNDSRGGYISTSYDSITENTINAVTASGNIFGDYRSYYQRPAVKFSYLYNLICDRISKEGYNINLDNVFFNSSNFYWDKLWIILPQMLTATDVTLEYPTDNNGNIITNRVLGSQSPDTTTFLSTTYTGTFGYTYTQWIRNANYNDNTYIHANATITSTTNTNVSVSVTPTLYVYLSQAMKNALMPQGYETLFGGASIQGFVPTDTNGNRIKNDEVILQYSSDNGSTWTDLRRINIIDYVIGTTINTHRIDLQSIELFGFPVSVDMRSGAIGGEVMDMQVGYNQIRSATTIDFVLPITSANGLQFRFRRSSNYEVYFEFVPFATVNSNLSAPNAVVPIVPFIRPVRPSSYSAVSYQVPTLITNFLNATRAITNLSGYYDYSIAISTVVNDGVRSGFKITWNNICRLTNTMYDLFVGYNQMFGLIYDYNNETNTISVYSRNTYYTNNVIDISKLVLRNSNYKITPLYYDFRYGVFKNNENSDRILSEYKTITNFEYGELRFNTNYAFNNNSVQLNDKSIFDEWINTVEYSPLYNGRVDYQNFDNKSLCHLEDKSVKSSTASLVPVFIDNIKSTNTKDGVSTDFIISDDDNIQANSSFMFYDYNRSIANSQYETSSTIRSNTYPNVTDLIVDESTNAKFSMLFSVPSIKYSSDITIDSTIYTKFWNRFISDRYSNNTKKLTCDIILNDNLVKDCFRKLYIIDNVGFVLNSIDQYVYGSPGAYRCELISVTDYNNYTSGQDYVVNFIEVIYNNNVILSTIGASNYTINSLVAITLVTNIRIVGIMTASITSNDINTNLINYNTSTGVVNIDMTTQVAEDYEIIYKYNDTNTVGYIGSIIVSLGYRYNYNIVVIGVNGSDITSQNIITFSDDTNRVIDAVGTLKTYNSSSTISTIQSNNYMIYRILNNGVVGSDVIVNSNNSNNLIIAGNASNTCAVTFPGANIYSVDFSDIVVADTIVFEQETDNSVVYIGWNDCNISWFTDANGNEILNDYGVTYTAYSYMSMNKLRTLNTQVGTNVVLTAVTNTIRLIYDLSNTTIANYLKYIGTLSTTNTYTSILANSNKDTITQSNITGCANNVEYFFTIVSNIYIASSHSTSVGFYKLLVAPHADSNSVITNVNSYSSTPYLSGYSTTLNSGARNDRYNQGTITYNRGTTSWYNFINTNTNQPSNISTCIIQNGVASNNIAITIPNGLDATKIVQSESYLTSSNPGSSTYVTFSIDSNPVDLGTNPIYNMNTDSIINTVPVIVSGQSINCIRYSDYYNTIIGDQHGNATFIKIS